MNDALKMISKREKVAHQQFEEESAKINSALLKLGANPATVSQYCVIFCYKTDVALPDSVVDIFVRFITAKKTSNRVKAAMLNCLYHPNHFRHHDALLKFLRHEVEKVPGTAICSPSPLYDCACAISYSVPPKLRFQIIGSLLKDKSWGRFARSVFIQNILRLRSKEAKKLLTELARSEPELFPNKNWIIKLLGSD